MTASSDAEIAATQATDAERSSFDPPAPRGLGIAITLALLAHLLLILALAWGLRWKKDAQDQAVDAELWSAVAQLAAPKAAMPPPPVAPPAPPPSPTKPSPAPKPKPDPAPPVPDDSARQAEIALEQQREQEQQRRAEEKKRKIQEEQRKAEEKKRKAEQEQRQAEQEQKRQQAQREEEQRQLKIAQAKTQADAEKKAQAARMANLRRMTALASADQAGMINPVNGPSQTPGGTATRDAGPSAGWKAKVIAKIKPNIKYSDLINIKGNPEAEVKVITSPDGTIIGTQLTRASGNPSWDNAVLRAFDITQTLPRDVDGRVPSPVTIRFKPHE
jgi:colicin import membrane protein